MDDFYNLVKIVHSGEHIVKIDPASGLDFYNVLTCAIRLSPLAGSIFTMCSSDSVHCQGRFLQCAHLTQSTGRDDFYNVLTLPVD